MTIGQKKMPRASALAPQAVSGMRSLYIFSVGKLVQRCLIETSWLFYLFFVLHDQIIQGRIVVFNLGNSKVEDFHILYGFTSVTTNLRDNSSFSSVSATEALIALKSN
jgi:hypothetical protein